MMLPGLPFHGHWRVRLFHEVQAHGKSLTTMSSGLAPSPASDFFVSSSATNSGRWDRASHGRMHRDGVGHHREESRDLAAYFAQVVGRPE